MVAIKAAVTWECLGMVVALMIDSPPPFAPRAELLDFLREMATYPDQDHPAVKRAIAKVQGYLDLAEKEPRHRE